MINYPKDIIDYFGGEHAVPLSVIPVLVHGNLSEENEPKGYADGDQVSNFVDENNNSVSPDDTDTVFDSTTGVGYNTNNGKPTHNLSGIGISETTSYEEQQARTKSNVSVMALNTQSLLDLALSTIRDIGPRAARSFFSWSLGKVVPGANVVARLSGESLSSMMRNSDLSTIGKALGSRGLSIDRQVEFHQDLVNDLMDTTSMSQVEIHSLAVATTSPKIADISRTQSMHPNMMANYSLAPPTISGVVSAPPASTTNDYTPYDLEVKANLSPTTTTTSSATESTAPTTTDLTTDNDWVDAPAPSTFSSYPGTTLSHDRDNFSSRDAEGYSGGDVGVDAGPSTGDPGSVGHGGADPGPGLAKGGPVNMQLGGETENADTDLENRLGPMGVIRDPNGDPGPSRGGAGVSDDLTMEVPEGSYILNSDAVALVGVKDINAVIRDAYTIASATGQELPADYDPQNKIPIRISNGEAVIPSLLVKIIGLDQLEKWNKKGLQFRKQKEKMMAQQQQAQPPQQPQVASEAPPVQPQSPMQAQMGGLIGYNEGDTVLDPETATAEEMEALLRGVPEGVGPRSDINESIEVYSTDLSDEEISGIIKKHYGGTPPKEFKEYFYENNPRTIEEVFESLKIAEWRNSPELQDNNTLKFTGLDTANKKGKYSSAFGDIQITATRAKDLLKLIPEENVGLKEYTKNFIEQGNERISQLKYLNSSEVKSMKEKNLPIPKPNFNLLGKGEGKISKEDHEKYYRELSDLHLNNILDRIRLLDIPDAE